MEENKLNYLKEIVKNTKYHFDYIPIEKDKYSVDLRKIETNCDSVHLGLKITGLGDYEKNDMFNEFAEEMQNILCEFWNSKSDMCPLECGEMESQIEEFRKFIRGKYFNCAI